MKVLHLNSEKTWRGGENQIRLLIEGIHATRKDVKQYLAAPEDSEILKRVSDKVDKLPLSFSSGLNPGDIFKLGKFCRANHIDIIDAHSSKAHNIGAACKILNPKLKFIVHRRVDYLPKPNPVNRLKYDIPDQYVAISNAIGDILQNYGIATSKISIARSAVSGEPYLNLDKASCKKKIGETFGVDPNLTFIGNASAFTHQKGYETLLNSIAHLKSQSNKFHCFIAGDGPLASKLEQMRIDLKLDDELTFLGFIDRVPEFLSALDILAVPSNYEGLGTILLDGAHAGCTLVGSQVGGIPEIIKDKGHGCLIPVGDSKQLAKELLFLIDHPDEARKMADLARTNVHENFSINSMVNANLDVYEKILGKKS